MQVKVLSVKNPFAYLILQGGKDVENRTWTTDYRGRLYIHASGDTLPYPDSDSAPPKILECNEDDIFRLYADYVNTLDDYIDNLNDRYVEAGVPTGTKSEEEWCERIKERAELWLLKSQSIIGYVDLVDIIQNSSSPWSIEGQYHWILKNPTLLENPIRQVKGRLGLWNYNLP